ncbi:FAD-dependent oxidoreductase [Marmoricola sp. URHB0036]|uniref:FAD-dependent oxidoreductase n=1 Tax=Marmoricola sp. URHB0036 TaxID=1298863 RepID=UPI0003FFF38D|nr:FAD-dependent oxidoreductase [Marmoricola sp. URHB0036]
MTSLWIDRAAPCPSDPLPDEPVQDLVVGAGLTGLVTALLLARAGRRVAVVEAREVGAVATGNTTAKISLLQGTKYSRLLHYQSQRVGQAYVEANREGMDWLLRFCNDHGVSVQRRPAVTYAASESEVSSVRDEHDAAVSVGLDVTWTDRLDVPFPHHGATVLADQAQFDPMEALAALVGELRRHGGTLHQGHRVRTVSLLGTPEVRLDDGSSLRAEHVVLATGSPILDRGLYFAKVEPMRSYALAFEGAAAPEGMYLSAGSDTRSVRDAPTSGSNGTRLLVGGAGHSVGRTSSEAEHVDRLREWTAAYFPGAVETHQWSAQDYRSHDSVPYVGSLPRGFGRIHLATGFDKWGMTNGVAAARVISGEILGQKPSWAKTLGRRITGPTGAAHLAAINIKVGLGAVQGATERLTRRDADGVFPICTHLGGPLHWNDCEESWDCPLHGSRFAPDGEVLEGPATRPLRKR